MIIKDEQGFEKLKEMIQHDSACTVHFDNAIPPEYPVLVKWTEEAMVGASLDVESESEIEEKGEEIQDAFDGIMDHLNEVDEDEDEHNYFTRFNIIRFFFITKTEIEGLING